MTTCLNVVGHSHSEFPPIGSWPAVLLGWLIYLVASSRLDRTALDQGAPGLNEGHL